MTAVAPWSHYPAPPPELAESGIRCLGAGAFGTDRSSVRHRTLDSHALVYLSRGSGWFSCGSDGGRHIVRAPGFMSVAAGVDHSYGPDGSGWMEHWILLDGVGLAPYVELGVLSGAGAAVTLPAPPRELPGLFVELRSRVAVAGLRGALESSGVVHRILLALAASLQRPPSPSAEQLLDRLLETATRQGSVAERARWLGLGEDELREVVRAATGLTPIELLVQTRVSRAQELLASTDLDVSRIAGAVGYDDPAYFARLFSRRVGVPPSEFRRRQSRRPDGRDAG
jgi:AraC-like DNA-binding protein